MASPSSDNLDVTGYLGSRRYFAILVRGSYCRIRDFRYVRIGGILHFCATGRISTTNARANVVYSLNRRRGEQDAAPQIRPRWWVGGLTGGGNVVELAKCAESVGLGVLKRYAEKLL